MTSLLLAGLAGFAATTIIVNGKAVTVSAIEQNGKAFLDIVTLMKLLGGTATYDAQAHKVIITPAAPATAGGAGGTVQLPGENGEFGAIYSLRKDNPLNFILKSAEYTTEQVRIGSRSYVPNAEQKMLVLHFSVQNPLKTEYYVRFDSLLFTAVDAMNVNNEYVQDWGDEESRNPLELSLKPAQKVDAYTVIKVPAKGIVPKLMVLPGENNGPILRYDLHEKVTGLTAPIADPADPTGATALETVPGTLGALYPYANFDVKVEGFSYSDQPLADEELAEGERYLFITVLMKNNAGEDSYLRWDTVTPLVTDTDGVELNYKDMLTATSNRSLEQNVKKDQEMRVRLCINVPAGSTPVKLALKEGESRTYEFEIK